MQAWDRGNFENTVTMWHRPRDIVVVKQFAQTPRLITEVSALSYARGLRVPHVLRTAMRTRCVYMTHLSGRPWSSGYGSDERSLGELAKVIAALHSRSVTAIGPVSLWNGRPRLRSWRDYVEGNFRHRLSQAGLDVATELRLESWFRSQSACLVVAGGPVLLHGDLKPSNVIIDDTQGVGLVDFERSLGGPPVYDLGKAYWRIFGCADDKAWDSFAYCYAGRQISRTFMDQVQFYAALHAIGALAYFRTSALESYKPIADSARDVLERLVP